MTKKILFTTLIMLITIFSFSLSYNKVYAEDDGSASGTGVFGGVPKTITPGAYDPGSATSATGADTVKDIGNNIVGVLQVLGSFLSVAVLAILGIKYMVGSVEERAEYKKTMMPYLIGAIMVFAITNLLAIIAKISSNLF